MPSPEDMRQRDELAEAIANLCHGFRNPIVGAALVNVTAAWLSAYDRDKWPDVFGHFLETTLRIAMLTQEQRKETEHGKAEANRN